jgi:glycosyltransferase involved in cell wall biosynthesis
MAAGLPVVATWAGGPAEIITNEIDGLLVPPGDVPALTNALRRLLDDETLRQRLGKAARERAKDFAPAVIGAQVRGLYDQLLASG